MVKLKIVPSSSGGEGNTNSPPKTKKKQIAPSKKWCFTINNWTEQTISSIVPIIKEKCRLALFAKEVGEEGTPHLQGYLELLVKARPLNLFPFKNIHWENAKGTLAQQFIYCAKEDKNPWCWNCRIPEKLDLISETQLYDWQKDLVEIINTKPDNRTIHWYWSTNGMVGKTCFCKYLTFHYGAMCLHGKGSDVRNGVISYVTSQGTTPHLVLIPIPRSKGSDYVSYEALENIKDMYFYSGKYEGGQVNGNSPHLIIFANCPPDEEKMSEDRWNIVNIDPDVEF